MTEIQEGMTGRQVSDALTANFNEVNNSIAEAKRLTSAEETRAIGAENNILDSIAEETTRAQNAETSLQEGIDYNTGIIADIGNALIQEQIRAKAAEQANADAITAEVERAQKAEMANADAISELNANQTMIVNALGEQSDKHNSLAEDVNVLSGDLSNLEVNTGVAEYPVFLESEDYAVGDVVQYEGLLYRFTVSHEAGEWNAEQVESWSERKEITLSVADLGISKESGKVNIYRSASKEYWGVQHRYLLLSFDHKDIGTIKGTDTLSYIRVVLYTYETNTVDEVLIGFYAKTAIGKIVAYHDSNISVKYNNTNEGQILIDCGSGSSRIVTVEVATSNRYKNSIVSIIQELSEIPGSGWRTVENKSKIVALQTNVDGLTENLDAVNSALGDLGEAAVKNVDSVPTEGSENLVTSGGVKKAISDEVGDWSGEVNASTSEDSDRLTFAMNGAKKIIVSCQNIDGVITEYSVGIFYSDGTKQWIPKKNTTPFLHNGEAVESLVLFAPSVYVETEGSVRFDVKVNISADISSLQTDVEGLTENVDSIKNDVDEIKRSNVIHSFIPSEAKLFFDIPITSGKFYIKYDYGENPPEGKYPVYANVSGEWTNFGKIEYDEIKLFEFPTGTTHLRAGVYSAIEGRELKVRISDAESYDLTGLEKSFDAETDIDLLPSLQVVDGKYFESGGVTKELETYKCAVVDVSQLVGEKLKVAAGNGTNTLTRVTNFSFVKLKNGSYRSLASISEHKTQGYAIAVIPDEADSIELSWDTNAIGEEPTVRVIATSSHAQELLNSMRISSASIDLFDFAKNFGFVKPDGNITADDGWIYSDLIPIANGSRMMYNIVGHSNVRSIDFFDENKVSISSVIGENDEVIMSDFIDAPANTCYVRVCGKNGNQEQKCVIYADNKFLFSMLNESSKRKKKELTLIHKAVKLRLGADAKILLYGDSISSTNYPWYKEWMQEYTGLEDVVSGGIPGYKAARLAEDAYLARIFSYNPNVLIILVGGNDSGNKGTVGTFGLIEGEPIVEETDISTDYNGTMFIQAVSHIIRKVKAYYDDIVSRAGLTGEETPEEKIEKISSVMLPYVAVCTTLPQKRESSKVYENPENWKRKRDAIVECCNKYGVHCIDLLNLWGVDMNLEPRFASPTDMTVQNGIYTMDGLHPSKAGYKKIVEIITGEINIEIKDN